MREMSRHEAFAFLAEDSRTGKLATASPAAVPHVAPIWFVVDGEDIVFTTWHASVKGRNLHANPQAALVVDRMEFPHDFVLVRGPVAIERSPADPVGWATRIAARYVPAGRAEEFGERNGVPGEWLCRLKVEWLVAQAAIAE